MLDASINQGSHEVNHFPIKNGFDPLGNKHEITQVSPVDAGLRIVKRLERWQLQNVARSLLPEQRVCKCHRTKVQSNVDLMRSKEGKVHYKGLMVCGSVWVCPVCASKISERRRLDLVEGVTLWKEKGGSVYLLTLTAPHYYGDDLRTLLERFTNARRLFRNRTDWLSWSDVIGLKGSIRALETTYGFNSWHNHTHELLFCKNGLRIPESGDILNAWQKACIDASLEMPNEHGLRIDKGDKAAKYASKWGIEDELTKAHIKKGRDGDRKSPFDLLREVLNNGCVESARYFREYAGEFKGKKQLSWSRGLRSLLGFDVELTDEEIAEQNEEGSVLLGSLTYEQWKAVLSADKRGELLEVAKTEGWHGVLKFIEKIS